MKKCSCIVNNNFNFVIDYKEDYLLFIDKSEWQTSEYNTPLDTYPLTIKNGEKTKTININVGSSTIIKYCDLPSDNGCGNDGIYEFIIDNCGDVYTKCEAILISIMCSYTKLLVTTDLNNYTSKIWPIFREIEFIKANSRICNINEAKEHYTIVKKMFEHLNCKC
jgi:hypothetical protein